MSFWRFFSSDTKKIRLFPQKCESAQDKNIDFINIFNQVILTIFFLQVHKKGGVFATVCRSDEKRCRIDPGGWGIFALWLRGRPLSVRDESFDTNHGWNLLPGRLLGLCLQLVLRSTSWRKRLKNHVGSVGLVGQRPLVARRANGVAFSAILDLQAY